MYVMFSFTPRPQGGGAFPVASPTMVGICGLSPEEVRHDIGPLFDRIEPDDLARLKRAIAKATRERTAWDVEFRYRHPHKGLLWMRAHCTPLRGPDDTVQWHGFINDITQRRQDQRELEKNERQLQLALLSSGTGIWSWDLATDVVTWTDEMYRIFGTQSFGQTPDDFRAFVHPDDRERVWAAVTAAIAEDKPYDVEFRIVRPDGQVRWLSNHGLAAYDRAGRPLGMTGTARDITTRKEADDELRKFAFLANNSHDFIGMCDLLGQPFFVNPAGLALVGLERMADACAVGVEDYFFPEDRKMIVEEFLPRVLEQGHSTVEVRFRHFKTEQPLWMSYSVSVLRDEYDRPFGYATISQNIDARKQNEAQMRTLMDELNHRVRNTLAIVNSIATQTLKHTPSLPEFRAAFTGRIAALAETHTLLASTRWGPSTLNAVISQQLDPYTNGRADALAISGPRLLINPKQALTLSLVFHELAANAVKYGALSVPAGHIEICWRIDSEHSLQLTWQESGGPRVAPPARRGFGSQLIEFNIAHEFGGDAVLDYRPEGMSCLLTIPLRSEADEI